MVHLWHYLDKASGASAVCQYALYCNEQAVPCTFVHMNNEEVKLMTEQAVLSHIFVLGGSSIAHGLGLCKGWFGSGVCGGERDLWLYEPSTPDGNVYSAAHACGSKCKMQPHACTFLRAS